MLATVQPMINNYRFASVINGTDADHAEKNSRSPYLCKKWLWEELERIPSFAEDCGEQVSKT